MTRKNVAQAGDRFGLLTVIEPPKMAGDYKTKVICDCGKQKDVSIYSLVKGHTQSCGCLQKKRAAQANFKPIVEGARYGRLVVLRDLGVIDGHHRAEFACDCGAVAVIPIPGVRAFSTQSCGCLQRERASEANKTHGHSKNSLTYRVWLNMFKRCRKESHPQYKDYGGRGITVCPRWERFENFLKDMGEAPVGGSIERVNVNGNYELANCIWLDKRKQAINRRVVRIIEIDGVKYKGSGEAAAATGLNPKGLEQAVRKGQTRYKHVAFRYIGRVGDAA